MAILSSFGPAIRASSCVFIAIGDVYLEVFTDLA